MRIRRPWLVLAVLLIPTATGADDHFADLYAAFSRADGSTLLGFHESYAVTLPTPKSKDVSVLGDFSVHFGSHDANDVTQVTFMGGPRLTLPWQPRHKKHLVSVHALFGGVYTNDGADSPTDPALAFGAGWEYLPARRPSSDGWGIRVQGDYIFRFDESDDFLRLSVGVVYRFKKEATEVP